MTDLTPARLTRTQSVFHVAGTERRGVVSYRALVSDDDPTQYRVLDLPEDTYWEMGCPATVTVTAEPGDLLNVPEADETTPETPTLPALYVTATTSGALLLTTDEKAKADEPGTHRAVYDLDKRARVLGKVRPDDMAAVPRRLTLTDPAAQDHADLTAGILTPAEAARAAHIETLRAQKAAERDAYAAQRDAHLSEHLDTTPEAPELDDEKADEPEAPRLRWTDLFGMAPDFPMPDDAPTEDDEPEPSLTDLLADTARIVLPAVGMAALNHAAGYVLDLLDVPADEAEEEPAEPEFPTALLDLINGAFDLIIGAIITPNLDRLTDDTDNTDEPAEERPADRITPDDAPLDHTLAAVRDRLAPEPEGCPSGRPGCKGSDDCTALADVLADTRPPLPLVIHVAHDATGVSLYDLIAETTAAVRDLSQRPGRTNR